MTTSPSRKHVHAHSPLLVQLLDLDAIVQSASLDEAVSVAATLLGAREPTRILDVGAGTGTGSAALARRFGRAEIIALDVDESMLDVVRSRAQSEGFANRLTTVNADIGSPSVRIDRVDLVWSVAALHEVEDAGQAFRNLFDALRPGGHVVVVEMDAPPTVLPEEFAGLEQRLRDAAGSTPATEHPDWAVAMTDAGFELLVTRTLVTDRTLPAEGPAGDYAALELRRIGHLALPSMSESDQSAVRTLAGDGAGNVRELGELRIRGTRTLWAARRPASGA